MDSVGARVVDQKITAVAQDYQQQQQQTKQQNQEPLRCPRCDSINTKFCYYNNYSLSQPRHFCKACKRYWTRGGTLRNVPVGGGCRKNKRVRRSSTSSSSSCSSSLTNPSNLDANNSASSDGLKNPLFYGLPTNHSPSSDINFPFSRYDLQNPPQINDLGLGFSSSCGLAHIMNGEGEFRHGLTGFSVPGSKQTFQDLIFSNPLLSNYTTATNRCSSATISSLLGGSSLQIKGPNSFQTLFPLYENADLQMKGSGQEAVGELFMKEVKMGLEGQSKSIDHHAPSQNQMDQTMGLSSSAPSLLWGGGVNNLGSWLDPANNIASSVTSLI